jgi:hypothetical protein
VTTRERMAENQLTLPPLVGLVLKGVTCCTFCYGSYRLWRRFRPIRTSGGAATTSLSPVVVQPLPRLNRGRHDHGVVFINNQLVVFGGHFGHKQPPAWELQALNLDQSNTIGHPAVITSSFGATAGAGADGAPTPGGEKGDAAVWEVLADSHTSPAPYGSFGYDALPLAVTLP